MAYQLALISDLATTLDGIPVYTTLASLGANLSPEDGSLARVTRDGDNNGLYVKEGASGAGSWAAYGYDRVALVEGRATTLEATQEAAFATGPRTANLYDSSLAEDGHYINTPDGARNTNAAWAWSGLMPVEEGVRYMWWLDAASGALHTTMHFFGSGGLTDWLGSGTLAGVDMVVASDARSIAFTAPPGAAYAANNIFAGVAHSTAEFDTRRGALMLERGGRRTSYVAYAEGPILIPAAAPPITSVLSERLDTLELAAVRVIKEGDDYYVVSRWSETQDICVRWIIDGTRNGTVQPHSTSLIPRGSEDVAAAHILNVLHGPPAYASQPDDPGPLRLNGETIGANHGHTLFRTITATAHGKAVEDIGSTWTDSAAAVWVLLSIPDVNTLWMARTPTLDGDGAYLISTTLTGTTLTHASGATHTGAITVASSTVGDQIRPSVHSHTIEILLDGATDLTGEADGEYGGDYLAISEAYTITSMAEVIAYAQARVGSSTAPDYVDPSIGGIARVELLYRLTSAADCRIRARVDLLEPARLGASLLLQSVPLNLSGSRKLWQYIPDTLPIGGDDWEAGVEITSYAPQVNVLPATWRYADAPPSRLTQVLTESDGTGVIGFTLGFDETLLAGRPAIRATNLGTGLALEFRATLKKMYPTAFGDSVATPAAPMGARYQVAGYRRYFRPSRDGADAVLV
jgi:hypothetical protein